VPFVNIIKCVRLGYGAGIGASGVLGSIAGGNLVGQAIAGNIINQGVGIITGQQKGFSWAGVYLTQEGIKL
jgi:hypothetical protein